MTSQLQKTADRLIDRELSLLAYSLPGPFAKLTVWYGGRVPGKKQVGDDPLAAISGVKASNRVSFPSSSRMAGRFSIPFIRGPSNAETTAWLPSLMCGESLISPRGIDDSADQGQKTDQVRQGRPA